ncbi:hypothetical protein NLI96_g12510 [Meripilus lineatus]|uniref:LisH domain-containing protein n=1 Tax=Meripilus lineatus TaxID=2056292 RepID=A0AAD5UTR1_9APHY|nr:hypothetical protein NLI96_g12510 [Physisporinus lineatus]
MFSPLPIIAGGSLKSVGVSKAKKGRPSPSCLDDKHPCFALPPLTLPSKSGLSSHRRDARAARPPGPPKCLRTVIANLAVAVIRCTCAEEESLVYTLFSTIHAMATGPPSTSANPTQPPDQNSQPLVSWDGDRMFNIYILDYCRKRCYEKTANELALEADIPSDSQPPINAKQGLLFGWWSVFWVLFPAKSSGQASDDALLYTQRTQYRTVRSVQLIEPRKHDATHSELSIPGVSSSVGGI